MIMDAQTRNRPSLEVRTDYGDELADGLPSKGFRTHRSPLPSPSPFTAKPRPSPLQPSTPRYDVGMRQHEKAMVESLGGRGRQYSVGDGRAVVRPLSPIVEQTMAARVGNMAVESPLYTTTSTILPFTAPSTPDISRSSSKARPGRSIVDETRSMLLSGMTVSQASDLGTVANRRLSAAAEALQKNRRQSLTVLPPEKLQAWGHVYLNDPTKADVLVAPSALRRHSGSGQVDGVEGNRLAIRARIRPRSKDRRAFVIARSFDLEQLRTTLPTTPTTPLSSRRQSGAPPSPEDLSGSARTPTTPLTPLTPGLALARRRSSAAASGVRVGIHQLKGSVKEMPVREFCPTSLPFPTPQTIPHRSQPLQPMYYCAPQLATL